MFAIVAGKSISIIAVIATSKRNQAIVARKDLGVRTPRDLEGKRIGVTLGTSGHFFFESFLFTLGIEKNKVKIIDMRPGEMMEALTKGTIDAASTFNPTMKKLELQLGDRGVVFYDASTYSDNVCVSVPQKFVKEHPETIKKVLKALIKAVAFIKEKPDESRRIVSESLKIDKAVVDEMWDTIDFGVALDQSFLVRLEDQTRWAQKNGFTDSRKTPNYLDFIYFDGLQSVRPEAVRIIR